MRQEGYYWIKMSECYPWEVAYWHGEVWAVTEQYATYEDSDIHQINETRIPEPTGVELPPITPFICEQCEARDLSVKEYKSLNLFLCFRCFNSQSTH